MDEKTHDSTPADLAGLYQRSAFLRKLLDSSPDGIVSADMNGRILLFNRGAERILGYEREEAIASVNVARLYPKGAAGEILERMRSAEHGGTGSLSRQEVTCVARDKTLIPVSLTGGIISNAAGREVATFGIFRDLRPIREMQNQLLHAEKMASLGRMAAGVAHELNNPLSGIMLYAGLVLEQVGGHHAVVEDLKIIINEAGRCKQIVADLLDFSQPASRRHVPVSLNDTIREVLDVMKKEVDFANVTAELRFDEELPPILGEAGRLKQVFSNILLNAAQAMRGRGRLTIGTRPRARGNMMEVFISDTGPGIPRDIQPRIFEPFFTTKSDRGGTGLGLSVAYATVKEHRGTIRVESEEGQGATFTLRFPTIEPRVQDQPSNPRQEDCHEQGENTVGR
jgi:two-component system NtrC family sensor kinase